MTSQQTADQALALYQAHRSEPREVIESLLDAFFNFLSAAQYEEQMQRIAQETAA